MVKFTSSCDVLYTPETVYLNGRYLIFTDNAARIVYDNSGNFGLPADEPNLFYDCLSSAATANRLSLRPNSNVSNTGQALMLANHEQYLIYCSKYTLRIRSASSTSNNALVTATFGFIADKDLATADPSNLTLDGQLMNPHQLKAVPTSAWVTTSAAGPAARSNTGEMTLSLFISHAKYAHQSKEAFRSEDQNIGTISVNTSGVIDGLGDPNFSTIVHLVAFSHGNQQTGANTPVQAFTGTLTKTIWMRLIGVRDILNQVKDE